MENSQSRNVFKDKIIQQRLEKRDDLIHQYQQQHPEDYKTQFCRFYLRGLCIFTSDNCHYAHGVNDLKFKKLDLEEYMNKLQNLNQSQSDSLDESKYIEKEKRRHQPSLDLEKSFNLLFEYQPKLLQTGEINKLFTLEEINQEKKIQELIRDVFNRELQQDFVRYLFSEYKVPFLPKSFIEKCLFQVGWYTKFRKIINSYCCYEVIDEKIGSLIFPLPQGEDYDFFMEKVMVRLFNKYNLITQIPIKSSEIQLLYRKNMNENEKTLPDIYWYYVQKKVQLDDALQELGKRKSFVNLLSQEFKIDANVIESKGVFLHEKLTNIEKKSEIIQTYATLKTENLKKELCRFYLRGLCILDIKICKYAHSIDELIFEKIEIKSFDIPEEDGKLVEEYRYWEKNWGDIMKKKQPSLNLEFTHQILYDYQDCLIEAGYISKKYTLKEIDDIEEYRKHIRSGLHGNLAREFVKKLFEIYGNRYLKKSFVDKCFQKIAWVTPWNKILDGQFAFEVKIPEYGFVVLLMPTLSEYKKYIDTSIIEIIAKENLLEKSPINSAIISKHYYKEILPKDPFMPNIHLYLKFIKISMDEYLLSLQSDQSFLAMLSTAVGRSEDDIKGLHIFDSFDAEMTNFMRKAQRLLSEMLEKSQSPLIHFKTFEEAVFRKCKKEIERYHTNMTTVRKTLKGVVLYTGGLIFNFLSDTFILSIQRIFQTDLNEMKEKLYKRLWTRCNFKHHAKKETEEADEPNITVQPKIKINPISIEQLGEYIDFNKILYVENLETLQEAKLLLKNNNIIGVDIEGILSEGGMIELVQFGIEDKIIIFDLYKTKEKSLHEEILCFIKSCIEDTKICKVFHDCRKDSLALHLFGNCCPQNIFDISAAHTFLEHLKVYFTFKEELNYLKPPKSDDISGQAILTFANHSIEVVKILDEIKPPGLNDILLKYNAKHGINQLKDIMKDRFQNYPREYFLQRPIAQEFLVYSARDVEDLPQIKDILEEELNQILARLNIESEKSKILLENISKTYSSYGCINY